MMKKILVIDDETTLTEMLAKDLHQIGYEVLTACSGQEGLVLTQSQQPDLVILDLMMPYLDGFTTCQRLRERNNIPILILTAKTSEEDLVRGFEMGADDYLKKPFSLRELHVRVEALLKRPNTHPENQEILYDDHDLRIDLRQKMVYLQGKAVHLTPTEFKLLCLLVAQPGGVVTHSELLQEVWGNAYVDAVSYLAIYIRYLREKLEANPKNPTYIKTQWGVGYYFLPKEPIQKNPIMSLDEFESEDF